ncbi:MAG: DUF2283 domain-containing protein [Nitrospirae bacterium]|nr:DUF2283 domain-containing protein [Nitrospirota bacterium]
MEPNLRFIYDRDADILHIDKCTPYAEQESEELGDEVIARLNPHTGEVENLEVLFFSMRLLRRELFELPVKADMHLVAKDRA